MGAIETLLLRVFEMAVIAAAPLVSRVPLKMGRWFERVVVGTGKWGLMPRFSFRRWSSRNKFFRAREEAQRRAASETVCDRAAAAYAAAGYS